MLRGVRCGAAITRARDRILVEGRHEHTFVNPSAFEYRIGCFREAEGALLAGERSTFWSWFRGYSWSIALCGRCGAHLGWGFFREDSRFFGLILDQLSA